MTYREHREVSMSNKLRVGIVGVGFIANLKHLPSLTHVAGRVEVVALCDL